VMPKQ